VQFVDFVHGPMDLMGENGLYLYMVEMVIKKERNRVNLYVKARLYAHNDDLTFLLLEKS
jgi:hypothetical protein